MILKVNDLGFAYNGQPVLKDVCFELRRGQALGVLGVNGAGKSTLLKCLNRILRPRRGVVLLDGADVGKLDGSDIAKGMGYVPQHRSQGPLSVYDTILLGRRPHIKWQASDHDLQVVSEVMAAMRLEHLAFRPMERLSGGEAQKVIIARALAQEPEVLLLDEPTSSLDLRNQLEVMELIAAAVRERGIAAVISIHDVNLALRHLDPILMLKDGQVHSMTSPEDITPATIRQVYGVEVALGRVADRPVIIPLEAA